MKYKYNNQWKDLTVKAGDTLPIGTIVDYDGDTVPSGYEEVVDTGYNTNGSWIKFSNGIMICYNSKEFSGIPSNQTYWNDYYRTDEVLNMDFPETFIEIPSITMSFVDISGGALSLRRNGTNFVSTTNTGYFSIIYAKGAGTGNKRFEVSYVAIERWK